MLGNSRNRRGPVGQVKIEHALIRELLLFRVDNLFSLNKRMLNWAVRENIINHAQKSEGPLFAGKRFTRMRPLQGQESQRSDRIIGPKGGPRVEITEGTASLMENDHKWESHSHQHK